MTHQNRITGFRPWIAIFLLLVSSVSVSHAADWVYRVRPQDNIWNLSSRYIKSDIPWQKLQDYNKVADPYHLVPGSRVRIPIAWLRVQPAEAKVVAVIGSAHVHVPGESQQKTVTADMLLGYGTHIATDAQASLTLEFADGSHVLMEQNSALDLDRMSAYGRTGMVDTRLRLQRGRVSSNVTPMTGSAARFSIETPGTISSVRGTHFRVAADASAQRSQTEVLTGLVDVAGHGRHTLVPKGFGIGGTNNVPPVKANSLLPPPLLQCPSAPLDTVPYRMAWPPLAGATHYRVQIAPGRRFEALLFDQLVDTTQIDLPDMPNGTYSLRLRGADADQIEGDDAICTIDITGHLKPPLVIEPQPGSVARGERPRFRWTESEQAQSYHWQLATDAQFAEMLEDQPSVDKSNVRPSHSLPYGHYYWRIAANGRDGKQGSFSLAMPFELVRDLPPPVAGQPARSKNAIDFSWQPGTAEQRYHVQMDRDPAFTHPAVDQTVDKPSLQIRKPGSGTWFVRVQVVDSDGYAQSWGPTQKMHLPCMACRIAAAGGGAVLLWFLL
jgi:hypothetical protein